MADKKRQYIIIPMKVLRCKKLTANTKLLLGEIIALCNSRGFCWASNSYFADLYGVSNSTISIWVNSLLKNGFIKCKINDDNARQIFLTSSTKKLVEGLVKKSKEGYPKKPEDNNIKGQQTKTAAKDDFEVETKTWEKGGHKYGRDFIDYED